MRICDNLSPRREFTELCSNATSTVPFFHPCGGPEGVGGGNWHEWGDSRTSAGDHPEKPAHLLNEETDPERSRRYPSI